MADAGVELLPRVLVPLPTIRFEHVPALLCEDGRTLLLADRDEADQALIPKVL